MAGAPTQIAVSQPPIELQAGKDRYLRLGEVLSLVREHYPGSLGEFVELHEHCDAVDACTVVSTTSIDQFGFLRFAGCTSYAEIAEGFRRYREAGGKGNIVVIPKEAIFAEVKVLLADRGEPLRAALTRQPIYPQRAKILLPSPGEPRIWAFVAVAVLNSAWGHAFYHDFFEQHPGTRRASDGVNKDALLEMPLAARNYEPALVEQVAELAYQLTVLSQAQFDCHRQWTHEVIAAREHLLWAVARALGLDEEEERQLLRRVHSRNLIDAPHPNSLLKRPIPHGRVPLQLVSSNAAPKEQQRQLLWQIRVNEELLQAFGAEWLWKSNVVTRPSSAQDAPVAIRNGDSGSASIVRPELAIIKDPSRCAGHPTVGPTRHCVHDIVTDYQLYNGNLERLLDDYPNRTQEQVEAALAYYDENQDEIDGILQERREFYKSHLPAPVA